MFLYLRRSISYTIYYVYTISTPSTFLAYCGRFLKVYCMNKLKHSDLYFFCVAGWANKNVCVLPSMLYLYPFMLKLNLVQRAARISNVRVTMGKLNSSNRSDVPPDKHYLKRWKNKKRTCDLTKRTFGSVYLQINNKPSNIQPTVYTSISLNLKVIWEPFCLALFFVDFQVCLFVGIVLVF